MGHCCIIVFKPARELGGREPASYGQNKLETDSTWQMMKRAALRKISVLDRRNGPSGYIGVAVTYLFSQVFLFLQIECAGG
jgi:hypothetical protein